MTVDIRTDTLGHRASTVASRRYAVEKVIGVMHEQLGQALSLGDMAAIANSSPFHFNRIFRQIVGIPPAQFLYALRLQKAKHLLLTTPLNVTDVCYEVGYNSLGSFTTRFTDLVGVSPTHLRRLADDDMLYALQETLPDCALLQPPSTLPPSLTGQIIAPASFDGPVFVGLFSKPIPQGQPAGGTLISAPGAFAIPPVPPGRYFVLAAGLASSGNPTAYLLPDAASLHVGHSRTPVLLSGSPFTDPVDVVLRPTTLTDPPLLIALPLLVMRHMAAYEPSLLDAW